jgi:hypothetical protein
MVFLPNIGNLNNWRGLKIYNEIFFEDDADTSNNLDINNTYRQKIALYFKICKNV